MKTIYLNLLTLSFIFVFFIVSCKKEEDTKPIVDNNTPTVVLNSYTASGSYGDIIRYEIDKTNKVFKFYNETTGISDSSSYSMTTNTNISGIYDVNFNGNMFNIIELSQKIIATSAPSGRMENKLCFGITADLDLIANYSASDFAGKYLFFSYHDFNSSDVWGGYELHSDGTFTWNSGPDEEIYFDENIHFSGGGSGTWAISSTNPSRVIFTEAGIDYTGAIYPGKVMLLDYGVGGGYSIGIKYPTTHVTQSSVAGSYRILDVTSDGHTGVGTYTIPANGGNVSYYLNYPEGVGVDSGIATNFQEVTQVNNMFKVSADYEGEIFTTWFVLLPGEIMLNFCAGENTGIVSYGVGAKIN